MKRLESIIQRSRSSCRQARCARLPQRPRRGAHRFPDVPTIAELGYKNYNVEVWCGVMAPAKTPKDIVAQLAAWFRAAIKAPEVTPKLLKLGLYPVGTCLDDFAAHIRSKYEEYGRILSTTPR